MSEQKEHKMIKFRILLILSGILFIFNINGYARNCPSKLESNLTDINDKISAGIEIRGFYY